MVMSLDSRNRNNACSMGGCPVWCSTVQENKNQLRKTPLCFQSQSSTQKTHLLPKKANQQQTKTNLNPKPPEYTYHRESSFAKKKEEKEILCPEAVSQEPVFKQKKCTIRHQLGQTQILLLSVSSIPS